MSFYQNRRIKANRPGLKPKALTTLITTAFNTLIFGQKRRRKIGGVNESQVIKAFKNSREYQAAGEPDSNNSKFYNFDSDYRPRPKLNRNIYSREKKLLAVIYYKLTNIPGKKEGDLIWKEQKQKIL